MIFGSTQRQGRGMNVIDTIKNSLHFEPSERSGGRW
jgi:hypothetical protein